MAEEKRKQQEHSSRRKQKKTRQPHDRDEREVEEEYQLLAEHLDHYDPTEYLPGHAQPDPYLAHSFDDTEAEFDSYDPYSFSNDYHNYDLFKSDDI